MPKKRASSPTTSSASSSALQPSSPTVRRFAAPQPPVQQPPNGREHPGVHGVATDRISGLVKGEHFVGGEWRTYWTMAQPTTDNMAQPEKKQGFSIFRFCETCYDSCETCQTCLANCVGYWFFFLGIAFLVNHIYTCVGFHALCWGIAFLVYLIYYFKKKQGFSILRFCKTCYETCKICLVLCFGIVFLLYIVYKITYPIYDFFYVQCAGSCLQDLVDKESQHSVSSSVHQGTFNFALLSVDVMCSVRDFWMLCEICV